MNISIWLLTASCLAGGAGQTAVSYPSPASNEEPRVIYTTNVVLPEKKPGFFSGIRAKLNQRKFEQSIREQTYVPQGSVMPASYVPLQPVPQNSIEPPQAPPIQTVAAKQAETPLKNKFQNKVGCSEDYRWITGQLFYVHVHGGAWVVRFASVGQEDRFGGSVVLAPAVSMKNYREGDLVCVHGEVLNEGRASPHLGGALYRVDAIDLVERAD